MGQPQDRLCIQLGVQSPEKHPSPKPSLRAWPRPSLPQHPDFCLCLGQRPSSKRKIRPDAITQEAFHPLPDPSNVPSNSPAEEVVKGHWEGKHRMGWARTHRHFLTSGTAARGRGKVDFGARHAPREPHPPAETHALPLKRETETEGGNEKTTKQVLKRKVTPSRDGPSQPPLPSVQTVHPSDQREPRDRELAVF